MEGGEEKDVHIQLLQDTLGDLRKHNEFKNKVICVLSAIIGLLVVAFAGFAVYSHERFVKFVLDYDVEIISSITTDNGSQNEGSVSVNRSK